MTFLLGSGAFVKLWDIPSQLQQSRQEIEKRIDDSVEKTEERIADTTPVYRTSDANVTAQNVSKSRQPVIGNLGGITKWLADRNISLSDPGKEDQVRGYFLQSDAAYTGYPALVEAIFQLPELKGMKLKGNSVPLNNINQTNLDLHKRTVGQPITDASEIEPEKLKAAIFERWRQKNGDSGSHKTFQSILEPQ